MGCAVAIRDDEPTRVLVVDDNRDAAETLSFMLAHAGFRVETRFDGPSALAAAEQFKPDACVLDIKMPGMNGYELARALRAQSPDRPPVLATMTAYRDFDHVERAEAAGFDLYFTKPADSGELAEQLRAYLLEFRSPTPG
jgi:two-component system, OmpR family, response regulator